MASPRSQHPANRESIASAVSRPVKSWIDRSGGEFFLEPGEDVVQDREEVPGLLRRAPSFAVQPVAHDAEVGPAALGDEHPARQRQRVLLAELEAAALREAGQPEGKDLAPNLHRQDVTERPQARLLLEELA